MMRFLWFTLMAVGFPLAVDYYVYRNWRRFAGQHPKLRRTLPVYRVAMVVMPLLTPLYFVFSRWWEVEPKLMRSAMLGCWAIYYVPKLFIAAVLLLKDALRFVGWLFRWFQQRLLSAPEAALEATLDLTDIAGSGHPTDPRTASRRQFLRQLGWSAATVPFVMVGYSVFRTLYDFEVYRIDVPLTGLPRQFDGLTLAQLSDLHAGSLFSQRPMQEVASILLDLRPDVIAITGDFVNNDVAETPLILPALSRLRAELGVYGCLGNHDHYAQLDQLMARFGETPLDVLVNARRTIEIDGARLHLIGTDNTGFYQNYADLPRALEGLDPDDDDVRILMAHTPTYWDSHVLPHHPDIDLMLAGHTHGGQVGFEWGPLRYSIARMIYPRWAGLYAEPRADRPGSQLLYVNRGIGTVGPPLRLGIRPEISLLTLRRA